MTAGCQARGQLRLRESNGSIVNVRQKGIVLDGGTACRLAPMTAAIGKQLLPIYDTRFQLMLSDTRENPHHVDAPGFTVISRRARRASAFGARFDYAEQAAPTGLAEAFLIRRIS